VYIACTSIWCLIGTTEDGGITYFTYLLQVMTSRSNDVMSTCVGGDCATSHYYVMTAVDDDVDQQLRQNDCTLLNTQRTIISVRTDNDRHTATAAADEDDDDDDEQFQQQRQTLRETEVHETKRHGDEEGQAQVQTHSQRVRQERGHVQGLQDNDDDDDDDDDDNDDDDDDDDDATAVVSSMDASDETFRQSDIPTSITHNLQHNTQLSERLDTDLTADTDRVPSVLETAEQHVSAPPGDVSSTTSENIDENQIQQQHHTLPLTTDNQPINDRTETGNRISFDRKLIEEIDAAMHAQNDYRTSCRPGYNTAQSKHCRGPAHSSHVTSPVTDAEGYSCHVHDAETKQVGKTGKRRRHRGTSVSDRQTQKLSTAGLSVSYALRSVELSMSNVKHSYRTKIKKNHHVTCSMASKCNL